MSNVVCLLMSVVERFGTASLICGRRLLPHWVQVTHAPTRAPKLPTVTQDHSALLGGPLPSARMLSEPLLQGG